MCIFASSPRSFSASRICPPRLPSVIGPAFSGRFEFQIRRDHRVGRRGNNRLSSVSTRLRAVICFRRPTPLFGPVIRNRNRDLSGAVSLVTSHFYLWRHPVCIRIDSVIYFAADSEIAGSAASQARKGEFRDPRFDLLRLRNVACDVTITLEFSHVYLCARQSLFVRSRSPYARGGRIIADRSNAHA